MTNFSARNSMPRSGARKKIRKVKSNSRGKLVVVSLLVLFAGFMMKRRQSAPVTLQAKPVASETAPKIIGSQKQFQQMQVAGQVRTQILIAERAAGLRNLPLRNVNGQSSLTVRVNSMPRDCNPGDWDIIRQDQEWLAAQKSQLVLSLEELGGSKAQQKLVSVDDLRKNPTFEFPVELTKERRMLGLFLCSTHDGQLCQNQSRPDLSELSQLQTTIAADPNAKQQYPTEDKTFFFHLIVAYPDRWLLHDSSQTLESSQTRLQAALNKGGQAISPGALQDAMQRSRSASSLPGVVLSDALQIVLPRRGDQCR